ncbi:MAG: hypothetical protein GXX99_06145 [Clostridiales bacterium]|nr:hypothetical protein [Clostridiales bacterium]
MGTDGLKLVFCIMERGKAAAARKAVEAMGVQFALTAYGRGTADFAQGGWEGEKDLLLFAVPGAREARALDTLTAVLGLDQPGRGTAFTLPLSEVADPRTLQLLSGAQNSPEEGTL